MSVELSGVYNEAEILGYKIVTLVTGEADLFVRKEVPSRNWLGFRCMKPKWVYIASYGEVKYAELAMQDHIRYNSPELSIREEYYSANGGVRVVGW